MPEEVQEIHVLLITNCVGPYLFLRNEVNYYLCYMIQQRWAVNTLYKTKQYINNGNCQSFVIAYNIG